MKKLFKGLLVAGVGAAIGYIVAKKVNEKEEVTHEEKMEKLEKEIKVLDKVSNTIDKFNKSNVLILVTIGILLCDVYSKLYKQNQINLYTDYRCIGLAYNTKQLTKEEAISELKNLLTSETGYTVKKLVMEAINGIEGE